MTSANSSGVSSGTKISRGLLALSASLRFALLVVLDTLTPAERIAFVLQLGIGAAWNEAEARGPGRQVSQCRVCLQHLVLRRTRWRESAIGGPSRSAERSPPPPPSSRCDEG